MEKRERGKNYTEREKETLLEIVCNRKSIIENKKTDNTNVKEKQKAWEYVADEYNSVAQTGSRTAAQLKTLYETIKKKAKKEKAMEKVELYKTGGGFASASCTPLSVKCLTIFEDSVQEIKNTVDSNEDMDILEDAYLSNIHAEPSILTTGPIIISEEPISGPEQPPTPRTICPGEPYFKNKKKKKQPHMDEIDNVKLEILKIRREKEELQKNLLQIELKKKEMELIEYRLKLKRDYGSNIDI